MINKKIEVSELAILKKSKRFSIIFVVSPPIFTFEFVLKDEIKGRTNKIPKLSDKPDKIARKNTTYIFFPKYP
jgi:hypothetical protein